MTTPRIRRRPAPPPTQARALLRRQQRQTPRRHLVALLSLLLLLAALMAWGIHAFGAESPEAQEQGQQEQEAPASESWEDIGPDAFDDFQPVLPATDASAGPTCLVAQWMLERTGYAPGVLDGRWGSNTRRALRFFQENHDLEATGELDRATWDELGGRLMLQLDRDALRPVTRQSVPQEAVEGPFVDIPDGYKEMAELECLCYETKQEALAEQFHTTPEVLAQLNPDVDFSTVEAGDELLAPNVGDAGTERGEGGQVARIVVSKPDFWLHALDAEGNLIYHFPTTVGAAYDPSPTGDFEVTAKAPDPNFHYQPDLFPEVPDSKPDKMLPPGPNSPVGVMWMQLSKENYGIHGTGAPATIGHTTSHGCVRLTNWDVRFLAERVEPGVPVEFTGDRGEEGKDEGGGDEGR